MFIGFKDGLQFIISEHETELAGPNVVWKEAPTGFDQTVHATKLDESNNVVIISQQELEDLKHGSELRIQRFLPRKYTDAEILAFDYTIDPKKITPLRDRGRKVNAEYVDDNDNALIVNKIFTDIDNIRTGPNGVVTVLDLQVVHNWYREDGTIGLTKTQIVKSFTKTEAEKLYQDRREASISFLVSEVRGTVYEPYIDQLMDHYKEEIASYVSPQGSTAFAEAINNEANAAINAILDSTLPFSGDPLNFDIPVRQAILYQIHGITQQEMLASLQPKTT